MALPGSGTDSGVIVGTTTRDNGDPGDRNVIFQTPPPSLFRHSSSSLPLLLSHLARALPIVTSLTNLLRLCHFLFAILPEPQFPAHYPAALLLLPE